MTTLKTRTVYEALPNDANDKRAPGSWKVCVREFDAEGLMTRSQKYAQEIYSEAHARNIATALNENGLASKMLEALKQMDDWAKSSPLDRALTFGEHQEFCRRVEVMRTVITEAEVK